MKPYTIVGVIGHIDHGKTSLVAALTGVDTDTNPEEKRRGITIDLGFASFEDSEGQFALIDAPGHQKYIGNLLAGVAAIDVGLLVVAADQGVQAQTLEHAAILQSLGVQSLIVAISRTDLASTKRTSETSEELAFFLDDLGIKCYEIVETSTKTGSGIETLKSLMRAKKQTKKRATCNFFRMPIDRIFSKEGRGTVLAGTPWSGQVQNGDELVLARTQQSFRVRGIEVHGVQRDHSFGGVRTAINLAGIDSEIVHRGDELISPQSYQLTSRILGTLRLYKDSNPIRCPSEFIFHSATCQCEARILGPKILHPDLEMPVIIQTTQPIIFAYDQSFLLRRPYPIGSIAAGKLLAPLEGVTRKTNDLLPLAMDLKQGDRSQRLTNRVHLNGELVPSSVLLQVELGIPEDETDSVLRGIISDDDIYFQDDVLVSKRSIEQTKQMAMRFLNRQSMQENAWVDEESLLHHCTLRSSKACSKIAIKELIRDDLVVQSNRLLALKTDETKLSKKQAAVLQTAITALQNNRTPPTLKELAEITKQSPQALISLMRYAEQQRRVVSLKDGVYYSLDTLQLMCEELQSLLTTQNEASVAEIRDHLCITRKYAIPLLQYCDQNSLTVRSGEKRIAGDNLANFSP